ncbi:SANT [Aspergillus sclerotialis]|uniref:SANT n=1 Tax=Aspergillus sclerotialis TaxID=2070753 RepID=A0A3A2ZAW7_9EURO|nr:SANT [Aspergillus sclerotialis]
MAAQTPTTTTHAEADKGPASSPPEPTPKKKGRTNTPWTAEEEQRLKTMRDAGCSWNEIAKTFFPTRTEGSVKKHWYKDMHYAEFAENESAALREAIKEYEANKWKVIGQKVGKPAKACEQYAKEHFKNL